jgi:5-(carboxyamino)imidazole ribonucleotide synthase
VHALGGRCFCKSATGGYDGRGQGKVGFSGPPTEEELAGAWAALGKGPGVVEQAIDLEREISILVARSPRGEVKVYPAAWNHHENQILEWSVIPAPLPGTMAAEATQLAEAIAGAFLLEGILAVELFVTKDGRILVNELAPRPHNSYHASERACVTSQFEQLVRAVCNLPLGETGVVEPCAIANLLGDLWLAPGSAPASAAGRRVPHFDRALSVPGVRLHLYEKLRPRKGRKMGHLSAVAATPEQAVELVLKAKSLL